MTYRAGMLDSYRRFGEKHCSPFQSQEKEKNETFYFV
jgi:hypothetical protein